jgi:hypothetical protein
VSEPTWMYGPSWPEPEIDAVEAGPSLNSVTMHYPAVTYSAAWAELVCSHIDPDEAHDVLTRAAKLGITTAVAGGMTLQVTCKGSLYTIGG